MTDGAAQGEHRIAGPRLIAILGPFQSGKTSLLEAMLARGGGSFEVAGVGFEEVGEAVRRQCAECGCRLAGCGDQDGRV